MVKTGIRLYGNGNWSGGWIMSQEDHHHGDRAFYIKTENMGRVIAVEVRCIMVYISTHRAYTVYFCQSTINVDLETVQYDAWHNIEKTTEYNPTVRDYKILVEYSDHTRLVYNASHDIFGGLLSSRYGHCLYSSCMYSTLVITWIFL